MKNYLIGFVPAVLLALVIVTYVNVSNKNSGNKDAQSNTAKYKIIVKDKTDDCCKTVEMSSKHSENSIYQLNCKWKDQNNKSLQLSNFEGKKVVLAMIYTSCPTACPIIVNDMQKLQDAIPQKDIAKYHFVLVSIDPDIDTPNRLKQFASEKKLDSTNWTLLTGSKDNIAELAELIGFQYKRNSNGFFTHSNLITFLNKDGVIKNQSEGLEKSNKELFAMLNK